MVDDHLTADNQQVRKLQQKNRADSDPNLVCVAPDTLKSGPRSVLRDVFRNTARSQMYVGNRFGQYRWRRAVRPKDEDVP